MDLKSRPERITKKVRGMGKIIRELKIKRLFFACYDPLDFKAPGFQVIINNSKGAEVFSISSDIFSDSITMRILPNNTLLSENNNNELFIIRYMQLHKFGPECVRDSGGVEFYFAT